MAESTQPRDDYSAFTEVDDDYSKFVPAEEKDDYTGFLEVSPEIVVQEAERATIGAVQALDVMSAPRSLDWSDVNEQMDAERFREAEGLRAQGQPERAAALLNEITPFTTAGQYVEQQRAGAAQGVAEAAATAARPTTPSDALRRGLGPGLSSTMQPVAESAARNFGAATGGALGAAAFTPTPIGLAARLGIVLPLGGALGGAIVGTNAQEALLQSAETPEETQARQQRAAEDFARNPGASRVGAALASAPFFGPSLAQFGRAMAGDKSAIANLGIAGVIGGAMEVGSAAIQGRTADAADIAAGVFSNLIMNEPTRLGRKLGLPVSPEQRAVETAQDGQVPVPIQLSGADAGLAEAPVAEGDVFAGVGQRPAAPAPKTQPTSEPTTSAFKKAWSDLSAGQTAVIAGKPVLRREGGRGIPGGLYVGDDIDVSKLTPTESATRRGNEGFEATEIDIQEMEPLIISGAYDDGTFDVYDGNHRITQLQAQGYEGDVPVWRQVIDNDGNPWDDASELESPAPAPPTDEQRIVTLVEAGMSPEDAAAGLARLKATEAPPYKSESLNPKNHSYNSEKEPVGPIEIHVFHGTRGEPFNQFEEGRIGQNEAHKTGDGFYFETSKGGAEAYVHEGGSLIEGTVRIENPAPRSLVKEWQTYIEDFNPSIGREAAKKIIRERAAEMRQSLLAEGYDGYFPIGTFSKGKWYGEVVALKPEQFRPNEKATAKLPIVESVPEGGRTETAEPPTAARASEAPPELPGATSNKEAVVNAERAARDLDPIIKEARIENTAAIDRAQQVITQNPLKPQEIITRLRENPHERTISLEDSAVLLVERTKLHKTREELLSRALDETLDPEARATAKAEFDTVEGRLNELDQAAQDARSTWGRFGQLWQRSMRQDFSLAALERKARLKKGEALTPEEAAQVKTVADEIAAAQKDADAAIEKAEASAVERGVDEAITVSAKQPDVEPAVRSLADRIISKLDTQAEQARKRLRERFKKLGSAPDPLIVADFAIMAATRIAKSSIKAGQWFTEMVQEFGEGVRPYLQAAWDAADKKLDELVNAGTGDRKKRAAVKAKVLSAGAQQDRVTAAIAERIKEGQSLDSLGNYIDRLVDAFVAGGVRDRNALTAAVKGVLEPFSPGITDRKVHELISGYGKSTQLSKDPLKVVKRQLKGELQQVSKLEALAAKEPLKKTGPERRTPSDEERRLIKEVNEAKKAAGVMTTDPATQLKSTMDAARTRMANEIKDLTFEIETGQRPPTRTPIEYDQDIQIMRGLRDRLRETVRDLEGRPELTEEQRIAMTTRGLQDSIAALEARIAGQQPKTRRAAPDTPAIRALKAKRDALRTELQEMESADFLLRENRKAEALVRSIEQAEAQLAGTATRTPRQQGPESDLVTEARAQLAAVRDQLQAKRDADPIVQRERLDAAEAAVEKAIKKLDEQLQAGDISVQRAPSRAGSQRLEDLRMQRDALNRLRNQLRREARPKPNPLDVAIKARKAQLARREADYEARIATGDFAPRTRKPPLDISGDPAAMDALARVEAVKEKFTKLQKEWELKNRTRTEKVIGGIKATWDAVRNLKLSMDLSAPLQTAFAMASHPIEGARAMGKGARIFAEQLIRNSDTLAQREQQRIANSPNNKNGLYKAMKLDLSLGDKREENAASVLERLADLESRWAGMPDFVKGLISMDGQQLVKGAKGIAGALPKVVGLGIKASNAGFNAVANHMRARTADAVLARWAKRRAAPTKQQLELLGNQINAATGKGGLRGEEGIRALLFAPNYYLSILKQLSFQPAIKAGIKHEGGVAREVLEEYVRAAITMASIWGLQQLFGNRDKQTLDPRSQDFARAKTDRGTSLDFTMGRGAYVTLGAQLATGEKINKRGRVEKQDRSSAFLNFLKGRLSREISTALTTAAGTDFKGKPLDTAGLAKDLVAPLSWQDVDKVLKREGMTRGTFIQMLNLLGVTHRLAE